MRAALLTLLFPSALLADSLQLTLYAVAAKDADRIPLEVTHDPVQLATFLEKLVGAKRATTPLSISTPVKPDAPTTLTKGEDFTYFQEFTETREKVVGASEASRTLGYELTWIPKGKDGERSRFDLLFQWTPTVEKVPIAGSKPLAWAPIFHSVSAHNTCLLAREVPALGATWRVHFPLDAEDQGGPRQLYLLAKWSDNSAAE